MTCDPATTLFGEPNFEGHQSRECGEHRTVGPVRAWCFDCTEWCYPGEGCKGCRLGAIATAEPTWTFTRAQLADAARRIRIQVIFELTSDAPISSAEDLAEAILKDHGAVVAGGCDPGKDDHNA